MRAALLTCCAALCWALGYLVGKCISVTLWCYTAFLVGYKAGL